MPEPAPLDETVPDPGPPPIDPDGARTAPGPAVGSRFGPFEVLAEIARGGQGAVFRARHVRLGTVVALKTLVERTPAAVQRFQQEAKILARLRHRNLPAVSDLGEADAVPYLAMELVTGRDLRTIVEQDGVPAFEWTVEVLETVAHVLQYCHGHGLVHRDLKPANVLIASDGRPVLVDFGLVKRDPEQFALDGDDPSLSVPGEIKGTPSFMAPEQADRSFGDEGPWTDVYALGASLFYLLTGAPPHVGPTGYSVIVKLVKDAPPDPRLKNPQVPSSLARLCLQAMSRDIPERPPTAAAFAHLLAEGGRTERAQEAGESLKARFRLCLGPRFELFYALGAVTDPRSRLHQGWRDQALARLPEGFQETAAGLGGSGVLWAAVADALHDHPVDTTFEDLHAALSALAPEQLQRRILVGILHDSDVVDDLLRGRCSLPAAIARLSTTKGEWLEHVGVFPPDPSAPASGALALLLAAPRAYQERLTALLSTFWERVFQDTWRRLLPRLERSRTEMARLLDSRPLDELARLARLRIEVDLTARVITAIRGGYRLPFARLREAHLFPSAFNGERYWTTCEDPGGVAAFFPYFDAELGPSGASSDAARGEPELDPALVFKALGDSTRFAIVSLTARSPRGLDEVAELLGASRATIAHHAYLLREAGLVDERRGEGGVTLTARREAFQRLSELALERLFPPVG